MNLEKIEKREDITVEDFSREFLGPNTPVVLGQKFTQDWAARREWVLKDGKPDFDRLIQLYGNAKVQVAECDKVYFSDQKRSEMEFREFVDMWRANKGKVYCKDWHFVRSNPKYAAYSVISHLSDDWINLFYDNKPELNDDFKFSYMGGDKTWTPFHEDVFRSYSWSANICGVKKWIFVPPGQTHLFTDSFGNWLYDWSDYDENQFPDAHKVKRLVVFQNPGEVVFVPSGWWHQVFNIGDTISINHNWANEFNLAHLLDRLQSDFSAVKHALRDVADMEGFESHAQLVLKADSGTDYRTFFDFVRYISSQYLDRYNELILLQHEGSGKALGPFDTFFRSEKSVVSALNRIRSVLEALADDPAIESIEGLSGDIEKLISDISKAIDNAV